MSERRRATQGALALLPVLPLALLVGRVWLMGNGDPQTMILLIANLSPAGLMVVLFGSLLWMVPILLLTARLAEGYRRISDPSGGWPFGLNLRVPLWLTGVAACVAVLTWQLRYLPALGAILVVIVALGFREAYPGNRLLILATGVGLPVLVLAAEYYLIFVDAVEAAVLDGQAVTGLLLLLPPLLAVFLTGPLPAFAARPAILLPALSVLILVPMLITTSYLRAPLLPLVAIEVTTEEGQEPFPPVIVGYVITAQDHVVTVMDREGAVVFVGSDRIGGQVLCPASGDDEEPAVAFLGWPADRSLIDQLLPEADTVETDRRCQGRVRSTVTDAAGGP
ncbi:hypothetical protein [Actinoplanes rectilineatus]|uniref:hypothetical protein n=1 Tax=Actinoplanes rectilineatus TaxID=113571 RepID=UPI0005F2C9A5|nr:hypothetical protein [Actinoplanes rectilineatus]